MAIIHIEKAFGHELSIEDNFLYGDRILIAKVGKRDVTTLRESEGGWKVDGSQCLSTSDFEFAACTAHITNRAFQIALGK